MRLNKREARAKNLDWYFRWSYPLLLLFATLCMFMVIPSHLRLGKVDAEAFAHGAREAESNALRNYEIQEEDSADAKPGQAPDLAVVEQPQEELAANAMEPKDGKAKK